MYVVAGRFAGKRAIVTGASKGIGRATAIRLAAEGAKVALIARGSAGLEDVARVIREARGECLVLPADCAIEEQVELAVGQAADGWGGLDIVVSNAAVEPADIDGRADRLEGPGWRQIIDTNLGGQFYTCKHGARRLLETGGGAIVCVGSNCGRLGICINETAYSASKGGIFAMMRTMAVDFAELNIRVNMVIPGFIDTPMNDYVMADADLLQRVSSPIPAKRPGTADECAAAILWLASDEASYCIGTALVVDGGQSSV
jgi:NAD(P)-dependent dehydrogenase (short-subunit alcohol dehydrogenase family)